MTPALRPRFHFTPPSHWMNDPNGLVVVDGVYHLFYQCHPFGESFGPPHWGHAVSGDLVDWEHRAIALEPDDLGVIFSGSAAIDHEGDAGFGRDVVVAAFTHHLEHAVERQSLAYSVDRGDTWQKFAGNPVLEAPPDVPDFRDPKIFRWASEDDSHWVMALAVGPEVWLYTSTDLRNWDRSSVFGAPGDGLWECPDLFRLSIDDGPDTAWVLAVGARSESVAHAFGTRYFVGTFDGERFEPFDDEGRWADLGADFYAAQTWSDVPDGSVVWVAWMSNWSYAVDTPYFGWRGSMSIPRTLGLRSTGTGLRLTQQPIDGLEGHRRTLVEEAAIVLGPGEAPLASVSGTALDIAIDVDLGPTTADRLVLQVRVGAEEATSIVVDFGDCSVSIDRSRSGEHPLHREYGGPRSGSYDRDPGTLDLRVLVDAASVEVFAAGGAIVFTEQIFPSPSSDGVRLLAEGGAVAVSHLSVSTIE